MSKVQMPEPVAWAHFTRDGLVQIWSRRKTDVASLENVVGRPPEAVITTTQAEAYAAAKVREALEAAADLARAKYEEAMKRREGFDRDSDEAWIIDVLSQALTYSHMEHGIRQMIPQR